MRHRDMRDFIKIDINRFIFTFYTTPSRYPKGGGIFDLLRVSG